MPIRTVDAVEAFGQKRNICRLLGVKDQNATIWGYFLPQRYEAKIREQVTSHPVAMSVIDDLIYNLNVAGIHPHLVVKMVEPVGVKEKAVELEIESRSKMRELFENDDKDIITLEGTTYVLALEVDDAIKLQASLKRGDDLFFFNHDEMVPSNDLNLKRCIELFKLYPTYKVAP